MKNDKSHFFRKNGLLILTLALSLAVSLLFCVIKYGMHIDELFTYGLSNSHYAPFVHNIKIEGLENQIFTQRDFQEYLTVDANEVFDYKSVFYNQTQDTHPPLYYCVLNTVSSFFQGSYSKWLGLVPNLLFYLGTILFLFLSCERLFNDKRAAFIASLIYGLSRIALTNVLMIRMYMLMVFLTSILIWLFICLIKNPRWYLYPSICLVIFLGAMTQFYFCIYACFICIAFDVYSLVKKRYKQMFLLSVSAIAGVLLMIAAYPYILKTLFSNGGNVSGQGMLSNLLTPSVWSEKISSYAISIIKYAVVLLVIGIASTAFVAVSSLRNKNKFSVSPELIIVFVPAVISLVVIVLISPSNSINYISNLFLAFSVCLAFLIKRSGEFLQSVARIKGIFPFVSCCIFGVCFALNFVFKPGYLFLDFKEYDNKVSDCYGDKCIAFTDSSIPLTQSMLQLINFDEVFVCSRTNSDKLIKYAENSADNNIVVYVSRVGSMKEQNPNETATELAENIGCSVKTELYSYESYSVYLLEH